MPVPGHRARNSRVYDEDARRLTSLWTSSLIFIHFPRGLVQSVAQPSNCN